MEYAPCERNNTTLARILLRAEQEEIPFTMEANFPRRIFCIDLQKSISHIRQTRYLYNYPCRMIFGYIMKAIERRGQKSWPILAEILRKGMGYDFCRYRTLICA